MRTNIICILLVLSYLVGNAQVPEAKLIGQWSDSTLVPSARFNNTYNEIWGVVVDGVEYAVLGTTFGTHFFDLSDPSEPTEVVRLQGGTSNNQIIHRDYHDYDGYLYAVADEGANSTLQIIDLSFLPDSVSVVYDSKEFIRRTHNIFIDTSSAIMYSCITDGDDVDFAPLRLFDISDPFQPEIISEFDDFGGFRVSQVHDAYVENDTAYLNCGPFGFAIVDFTDPFNVELLAAFGPDDYVQSGYNHSGWLSEDGNTYVMADEDWGMDFKVWDVSDLTNIELIDTIDAGNPSDFTIPHNQIIHDGLLYVSYYYDGLQVYDITDVTNIQRVSQYPTSNIETRRNFEGAWGVYPFLPSGNVLVSDMQEGLFVLEILDRIISNTLDEEIKHNWDVIPNLSDGQFEIKTSLNLEEYRITLTNPQGQDIDLDNSGSRYNLSLAAGVYYVRLSNNEGYSIKPLIIID